MKLAVTDANIFIDLIRIDCLHYLFELKIELHTTTEVLNELHSYQEEEVRKYHAKELLIIAHGAALEKSLSRNISKKLAEADKSVIYYAKHLGAGILTGDYNLKKFIEKEIEVHGILWVVDQFVEQKLISENHAHLSLSSLMKLNKRLPKKECEKLLKKWKVP
ncbi:hypothetical protein RCC89_14580 [Cytophagaceae bacterium ABcell3]|nr:hypothetical protein RCC89_14580 [Cytophagaceae bacterium ABcell3]